MDVRRRLVNKNDAKKSFVKKTLDNHISDTHVTRVYTPICSHTLLPHMLQLNLYSNRVIN